VVKRFQPDVVHSYDLVGDVFGAVVCGTRASIRLITSRRGEDTNARHHAIRRMVNRCSDKIVCVSKETAKFVTSTESPRASLLEVIANGVAIADGGHRPRNRRPDEPIRFGTLGTVKPIKGTDLLVDAFMKFAPEHRVELLVAGLIDRPWAEALRQRAQTDPRIRFIGRSDPASVLDDIDVFVLPSRSEGMSNALLEAMAAGLPCIATDVGSNRSLLNPLTGPEAGVVVEVEAEPLFHAMREMAANPDSRSTYGARAASAARTLYTIPGMVNQYERLYRSVAGRPSTRREVAPAPCVTK
jgi:glycosyltransferase involved in cell wall biosynthesis